MAAMKKSVKTLVDNGFSRADAEALTEQERQEMIATLPPAQTPPVEGQTQQNPEPAPASEAEAAPAGQQGDQPEGEGQAEVAAEPDAPGVEEEHPGAVDAEPAVEDEPVADEVAEIEPDLAAETEAAEAEEVVEIEDEPAPAVEAAPFNAGVQHQLELKWQEFAAFAKTVEHHVDGELGDIVRWVKAHA